MKQLHTRKSFIKTMGLMGAGSLLAPLSFNANAHSVESTLSLSGRKRLLRVAHLTDIHIKPDKIAETGFANALQEVNMMEDKPDFIINGGDSIMNAVSFSKEEVRAQWTCFHKLLASNNQLTLHHCIGNHDLFGWALPGVNRNDGKQWALDEYQLSSPYYTFSQNGWKFIVLDSIHARKSIPGYFGKLDDQQLQWLESELSTTSPETHVCIVSHIPILAICTLFDNSYINHNHWFVPDNALHADARQLRDLFYRYKNVRTCLSGHIHLIDHVNYLGTDYYCNGAVSGGWWKGDHQQFSPSFIIINFYDDGSTEREIHYYNWNKNT